MGDSADDQQRAAWMSEAVSLGRTGMAQAGDGPFGAVVVCAGRIVGRGHNQVTTLLDPTAHAEVMAIRAACHSLGRFDLRGSELYTSCEPCPMCLAAIYWARLDRVFYACTRTTRLGSVSTTTSFTSSSRSRSRPAPSRWNRSSAIIRSTCSAKPDKIPY